MTTGASRVEPPAPPTRHPLPCPRPHSGAVEEPAGPGEDPQGIFIKAFASPAPVAQGIEHSSPKAGVAGSNPAWGTTARAPSGVTTGQFRGVILSNWPVVVLPARQTAGSAVPPARRIVHRVSDPSRTPTRESAPQRRAPGAGYTVGAGRGVLLVPQDVPSGRTSGVHAGLDGAGSRAGSVHLGRPSRCRSARACAARGHTGDTGPCRFAAQLWRYCRRPRLEGVRVALIACRHLTSAFGCRGRLGHRGQ